MPAKSFGLSLKDLIDNNAHLILSTRTSTFLFTDSYKLNHYEISEDGQAFITTSTFLPIHHLNCIFKKMIK